MKTLIFITTLLALSTTAFGKSLECTDAPSFTGKSFTINRDGAIGFDGTYITMKSQGTWGRDFQFLTLADITGRAADEKLTLTGLTLAISLKASCTNPNADVHTPFKCSAKNVTVIAKGQGSEHNGAIFDRITLSSQIENADVEVELVPVNSVNAELILRGTVKAFGKTVDFEIPVTSKQDHCKVTSI
jgi:hypothetical protein